MQWKKTHKKEDKIYETYIFYIKNSPECSERVWVFPFLFEVTKNIKFLYTTQPQYSAVNIKIFILN